MSATTPIHLERPDGKGLASGSLGLWGSTVIGLASTAPVYSLVATLGFVVLAVGAQAPIAFIIAFIPMLLIAFAYRELNNAVPDCGTTFTWGTKAFGPWVGWMGGWGVAVAGMVVLANLAQIASVYFWSLIGFDLENNDWRIILVAVFFIASMTWVSWRGVEVGERIQNILLAIQYLALAIFIVAALWQFFAGTAPNPTPFDIAWLNPFAFTDYSGFIEAILLALFIYWGWDTCLALNEETKDPKRIPGRA
ncbi:MAG: APC family permease, partial [Microbacterium sp.]